MYRYYTFVAGNTVGSHTQFLADLNQAGKLTEVKSPEESDFVIAFCPIVSRVGTDLEEALQKIPTGRPIFLVVLHHTFNPDQVITDSSTKVNHKDIRVTVDCLFHDSKPGLLTCRRNEEALQKVWNNLPVISGGASGGTALTQSSCKMVLKMTSMTPWYVLWAVRAILWNFGGALHWIGRTLGLFRGPPPARSSSLSEPLLEDA